MIAIETSAIEIRSPAVSSMSCSRGCGSAETCRARSIKRSVESPIAETTTQTSFPASAVWTTRRATRLISSGPATDVPPYFWTTLATAQRLPSLLPREQAEAGVRVGVQRPERRRQLAEAQEPAGDSAPRELHRAFRVLEPDGNEPRARERPDVRPERVHVLVDAELLLALLLRVRAADVGRLRPFVQRRDDAAAPRDAGELLRHRLEVECVVQSRDAEGDVEAALGERQPLAVRLDAQVGNRTALEEAAAT